jgi:hypothetical protein
MTFISVITIILHFIFAHGITSLNVIIECYFKVSQCFT